MTTKDIRTHHEQVLCDVCGRTLLRGERAETYLNGSSRLEVCELCKPLALQEGWVREGTVPAYEEARSGSDRGRGLFARMRGRGERATRKRARPSLDDELAGVAFEPAADRSSGEDQPAEERDGRWPSLRRWHGESEPSARPDVTQANDGRADAEASGRWPATRRHVPRPSLGPLSREPRNIRAVPTSEEQKIAAAIEVFNQSEHRRTVAGVARSLGAAAVCVQPEREPSALVRIVVSWELCWYRYTVDLAASPSGVQLDGQGYELSELEDLERETNAFADDSGQLQAAR